MLLLYIELIILQFLMMFLRGEAHTLQTDKEYPGLPVFNKHILPKQYRERMRERGGVTWRVVSQQTKQ